MERNLTSSIVYEDPEIQVFWTPGASDFVLITFGDLTKMADGAGFFADTPVSRLGFACIGIMPRFPHWYPAASLERAAPIIRDLTRKYQDRLLYGGSMGGYGAIKYSALLQGTVVIALCPQSSIEPSDCLQDDPWRGYFRPGMTGMGIRTQDIRGQHYIFYDQHNSIDRFHFEKIQSANGGVHGIGVPFVGHHVTTTFAGTQHLSRLVEISKVGDVREMALFARNRRRYSRARVETILRYAAKTRFRTTITLLNQLQRADNEFLSRLLFKDVVFLLNHASDDAEDLTSVMHVVRTFVNTTNNPTALVKGAMLLGELAGRGEVDMETRHKTVVFYDPTTELVVHGNKPSHSHLFRLGFDICGRRIKPYVNIGKARIQLYVGNNGLLTSIPADGESSELSLDLVSAGPGAFHLSHNGLFMTAEKNGLITIRRERAQAWEIFRFQI